MPSRDVRGNLSQDEWVRRGGSDCRARNREGAGRKPTRNGIERLIDWRLVGGRGGRCLRWELNEAAFKEEEPLDGRYWLVTTLDDSPQKIIETCRARDGVESGIRITKETIKIRSIWKRAELHIKAHLFVCFIAYLLYSLLELQARKNVEGITGTKALDKLRRLTKNVSRDAFFPTKEDEILFAGMTSSR